jgi:hypothetical protein
MEERYSAGDARVTNYKATLIQRNGVLFRELSDELERVEEPTKIWEYVISAEDAEQIFWEWHSDVDGSHQGISILDKFKGSFWTPGLEEKVPRWIEQCPGCTPTGVIAEKTRPAYKLYGGKPVFVECTAPWELVAFDICSVASSQGGNFNVFITTCVYSGVTDARAVTGVSSFKAQRDLWTVMTKRWRENFGGIGKEQYILVRSEAARILLLDDEGRREYYTERERMGPVILCADKDDMYFHRNNEFLQYIMMVKNSSLEEWDWALPSLVVAYNWMLVGSRQVNIWRHMVGRQGVELHVPLVPDRAEYFPLVQLPWTEERYMNWMRQLLLLKFRQWVRGRDQEENRRRLDGRRPPEGVSLPDVPNIDTPPPDDEPESAPVVFSSSYTVAHAQISYNSNAVMQRKYSSKMQIENFVFFRLIRKIMSGPLWRPGTITISRVKDGQSTFVGAYGPTDRVDEYGHLEAGQERSHAPSRASAPQDVTLDYNETVPDYDGMQLGEEAEIRESWDESPPPPR